MIWRESEVSPCGTHHVIGAEPLYEERFDWVLPFHAPGLAPVGRGGFAWHIDGNGAPAYERRWLRSFGFYQGLSAVVAEDGWLHIQPDGAPAYPDRWAWVGNFQHGRCPARDAEGRYRHMDRQGRPVGGRTWRYAGDYREGSAVVQDDDGLSLHVDLAGCPLNGARWLDLDVFHKGWARARDAEGWTHVDREGRPLYPQRYAMVEPFYNGQARVEERGGRRLVLDETGESVLLLRNGEAVEAVRRRSATPAVQGEGIVLEGPEAIPAHRAHRMAGRYLADVGRPLCRSVVGAIYRAWDEVEQRPVLVKSRRAISYAEREAHALDLLAGHPAAPALLDRFELGGSACLVIEPRPGRPLGSRGRCEPLALHDAVTIVRPLLAALERLHAGGLIHSDLHPLNVLHDPANGVVTLLDYELAVPWSSAEPWTGEIFWGLWEYVPPEQLSPIGTLTPASDTFAVGALLHSLLMGAPPFVVRLDQRRVGGWEAVREDCLQQRQQPLDLEAIPSTVADVLRRALYSEPAQRFGSAAAMLDALASIGGAG